MRYNVVDGNESASLVRGDITVNGIVSAGYIRRFLGRIRDRIGFLRF